MSLLRSRATTTMLQRSAGVFRHDGRTTQPDVNRSEAGDTLIEILIAMLILGVATLSLLAAFATSISASATHRSIATFDTVIRSAAQQAISQIQQQPDPLYVSCASASYYQTGSGAVQFTLPTGFAAQVTSVQYWNGSSFTTSQSQCTADSPEWITISVSNSAGQSYTNNFIVDDPYAPPIPANGNAYQLVFLQEPAGATTANNFTTQPVVAVEDDTGHVVTTDLSSVTLTITPNTGTSGANLSQYCTGVETSGVITFSDCSIDTAGLDYQLTATDPGLVSAISTAFNVYTQLGTPVITAANPSSTETGAINVVFSGSSNAPAGQTYTATACANSGVGFGCVTRTTSRPVATSRDSCRARSTTSRLRRTHRRPCTSWRRRVRPDR
jgi:type II secretory pathway pseudopilin PulG